MWNGTLEPITWIHITLHRAKFTGLSRFYQIRPGSRRSRPNPCCSDFTAGTALAAKLMVGIISIFISRRLSPGLDYSHGDEITNPT